MSADRQDEPVRDAERAMERDEAEMDERLRGLNEEISEAKKTAQQRQDAPDDEDVAGDWEDESSGAHHGDDAEDAVDER